jgi:hypothetical protein
VDSSDSETSDVAWPRLWNPSAAAFWCLVFSPAFGAYLHASNWRVLGKTGRARANMVWFWVTVAFLVINVGTLFVPDSRAIDWGMRLTGLGLLIAWYFTQAKSQVRYVDEAFGDDYIRKRLWLPLLIGVASFSAYIALGFFLAAATYIPHPSELAAEIKPQLLAEWRKNPELPGASIQNVTLVHKGGKVFTGFVDATLDGQKERLALEVVLEGGAMSWELRPLPGK